MAQRTELQLEPIDKLKEILLKDERRNQQELALKLQELEMEWNNPEELSQRLEPHFEERILYMQENFGDLFHPMVQASIKAHMRSAKDDVIEALYPMMGSMIRKYVRQELSKISERIDKQLDETFSFEHLLLRFKALITRTPYRELLMQNASRATIEEVFLIYRDSGLLLGHFSISQILHADVIAGMLTGIKDFVEHAFQKDGQMLENVVYDQYNLVLKHYPKYYFAFLVDGQTDQIFDEKLEAFAQAFQENFICPDPQQFNQQGVEEVSQRLKTRFHGFNEVDQ